MVVAGALVWFPGGNVSAQSDDDAPQLTGSLAVQLLLAADSSLEADAPVAVLRAYDGGYEVLQIVEAMGEALLARDGTITDEDGVPVDPFRAPSRLIAGDVAPSRMGVVSGLRVTGTGEQIALDVLERGVAKTTKRIDKKVDLEARAERVGASDEGVFTAMLTIALMAAGYSPEQIILDGIAAGGIRLTATAASGVVIVDENGKRLRPEGVEESPEAEEDTGVVDLLADSIIDLVAGFDPSLAAAERLDRDTDQVITVEIDISDTDGDAIFIQARGSLGKPKDRSLGAFLIGRAEGELTAAGECGRVPYKVTGPVVLGLSGPAGQDTASVSIAMTDVSITGDLSDQCIGDVETLEYFLGIQRFGPVDVRIRGSHAFTGRSTADYTFQESTGTVTIKFLGG